MGTKLEVTQLRDSKIVGPAGSCGTCGWYPKAWQVARVRGYESPVRAFLRANPNWTREDIEDNPL